MRISDWTSDVCSSDLKPFAGDVRNAGRGGAKAPRGQPAVVRQCRHCGAGRHRRPLTASGTEGSLSAITSKGGQSSGVGLIGGAEVRRVYVPRSEEHTSELQSLMRISYAVFCLKKKQNTTNTMEKTN